MKLIFDLFFQCQPWFGLGSQTRNVTCEDSDGNMSDKCREETPTTESKCRVTCFDNLEENGGIKMLVTVVDGKSVSVYIDHGEREKTHAINLSDFAEFLEISNSCLQHR